MENLQIELERNKSVENNLVKEQTNFLETNLGKAINIGLDIGIRTALPNFIEDSVIEIKDTLFKEGLAEGIKTVINSGLDLGKSIIGVFTGKFENINQMQAAVEKGGIIDGTSNLIDTVLNKVQNKKLLSKNVVNAIKQGKNLILDNVSKNIENTIINQVREVEKLDTYTKKWQDYYQEKDFTNMDKQYKKIEKSLKNIMPIEETIKQAREIENIHNLIKNNGHDFNITTEQIELSKKLM